MLIRPLEVVIALFLLLAALGSIAHGKVYSSKEDALQRAFPGAEDIETVNLYLSDEDRQQVRKATGASVESGIYSFYVGKKDGKARGYAAIEAGTVRTLPETVLVVMNPDGSVRYAEILAFFEPQEYKPSQRWLDQFEGERLDRDLRVGGDIQGISGATLSAQAMTRQVRKTSAMLQLLLEKR